jgi:hypothetical protein
MNLNLKKKVKKVGTSLGIVFSSQDREVYDIEYGDIVSLKSLNKEKGGPRC